MAQLSNTTLFSDANLTAYWKLENTSDSKGANTLTNTGPVAFNPGKYGNAADFGSSNTTKQLTTTNTLVDGGAISVSFWFKQSSEITSGAYYLFFQNSNTSKTRYWVEYDYNGGAQYLQFSRDRIGIATDNFRYTVTLGTGWNHICLTYDGTTLTGYLNGSSIGFVLASGNGSSTGTNGFDIGSTNGANYTSGLIDDMGVFTRALTSAEVLTLASDGMPNKIVQANQAVNRASRW